MDFKKWTARYYRLTGDYEFAGIRRQRDGWYVEIRNNDTGTLRRYGGVWPTLRDAKEEARHILNPTPLIEIFARKEGHNGDLHEDGRGAPTRRRLRRGGRQRADHDGRGSPHVR